MSAELSTKVVILGGGFAGSTVARQLGKLNYGEAEVEVTLINDKNYFVFQPMLPEVAAGVIEPCHILNPIRRLCPKVKFQQAVVQDIDCVEQTVTLLGEDITKPWSIRYDYLVLALGLMVDMSKIPGMGQHGLGMKTLGDAFALRNTVISRLEQAEGEIDPCVRAGLLSFVVVGGGFSGVETIGQLNDMVARALRYYPHISRSEIRMTLLHSGKRILGELNSDLAMFTESCLRERGIDIMLNTRVIDVSKDVVRYITADGVSRSIRSSTVVCTVGNSPHPVIRELPYASPSGRVQTNLSLQVVGTPCNSDRVYALGDAALVPDLTRTSEGQTPVYCPASAQYATRQAKTVAANIRASILGIPFIEFRFRGLGQLAIIGKFVGVGQVLGHNFSGFSAFVLWRLVYWMKLPGFLPKLRVALDWIIDALFPLDVTQLNVSRTGGVTRQHFQPGAFIFHEGSIADGFYAIERGEVDIVQEHPDGGETLIRTLKAGDSFGEIAVLRDSRRTAGARCRSAVDCISLNVNDFKSLSRFWGYDAPRGD